MDNSVAPGEQISGIINNHTTVQIWAWISGKSGNGMPTDGLERSQGGKKTAALFHHSNGD